MIASSAPAFASPRSWSTSPPGSTTGTSCGRSPRPPSTATRTHALLPDLPRVAPDALAERAHTLVGGGETLDGVAVGRIPRVPCVDVRKREREQALAVAADHQRNAARRARDQDRVLDRDEPPGERHVLAAEEPPDDLERLLEARDEVVEREPERTELRLVPPRSDSEDEPAARDLVDRGRQAREHAGRVKRGRRHERAETDSLGDCGDRSQLRPYVPRPALRPAAAAVEQVVAEPHRVEARLLGGCRDRPHLRPTHLALHLGKLHSHSERWPHHGSQATRAHCGPGRPRSSRPTPL